MRVHVNTQDLRQALRSVVPHAIDSPSLEIIRFTITEENLYVQATNGISIGLAIVSVWEHRDLTGDPNEDCFDMTPRTAKELLGVFKPKGKPENELDDQLQIMVDDDDIHVLDVSGLFPGKSYSVPNDQHTDLFPNLPRLFENALLKRPRVPERLLVSGRLLKLFSSAADAYGKVLTLEPTSNTRLIIVSCGDSFLGGLNQSPVDDGSDAHSEIEAAREGWTNRLPAVSFAIGDGRKTMEEAA